MSGAARFATVGMFDGVHRGHLSLVRRLIDEAGERSLTPTVFTFDRHPLSLIAPDRAPALLTTVGEKAAKLRQAGVADVEVLSFDEALRALTAEEFLMMLRDRYGVKALLMGFNHRFGSDRISRIEDYEAIGLRLGVEIVRADELRDSSLPASVSSSAIRDALSRGDVAAAARMLGYNYKLWGKVVPGRQLGRTIGFPTANMEFADSGLMVPGAGVYAVDVTIPDGGCRRGMMNIGRRPTVDFSSRPAVTAEVHVIDWSGNLYGKEISVEFLDRIRDEMRFPDIDALRRRITADRDCALKITENARHC